MPAGADVTVPVPVPASATVRAKTERSKRAVADTALLPAGTLHVAVVPVHTPDQLTNCEFAAGAADSDTATDALNDALHVLPQETPAGDDVIVPLPLPVLETLTVRVVGTGSLVPPPEQPDSRTIATAIWRTERAFITPRGSD